MLAIRPDERRTKMFRSILMPVYYTISFLALKMCVITGISLFSATIMWKDTWAATSLSPQCNSLINISTTSSVMQRSSQMQRRISWHSKWVWIIGAKAWPGFLSRSDIFWRAVQPLLCLDINKLEWMHPDTCKRKEKHGLDIVLSTTMMCQYFSPLMANTDLFFKVWCRIYIIHLPMIINRVLITANDRKSVWLVLYVNPG